MSTTTHARTTLPAAVLWDLDGTIVDTEPVWMAVEQQIAEAHGADWTEEDGLALVGNDLIESGRYIAARMGLSMSAEEAVDILVAGVADHLRHGVIDWRPGALELLASLADAGVPQALVTMSYTTNVDPLLERLPGRYFDAVVTGDVVDQGKPHPEPYLTAARLLGVAPQDCVAIEDSTTGSASAAAAGCRVLVVPNLVTVAAGERKTFVDSLTSVTPADLGRLT